MIRLFNQFSKHVDCRFLGKEDDRMLQEPFVRLHQVHGNRTIVARTPMDCTEQADGILTDRVTLQLAVRAADCQNFAVYAPKQHVGGVLHVGWRGLLSEAIPAFFAQLLKEFAIEPVDCVVAAGPSLCLACAEYKDEDHKLRKNADPMYVKDGHVDLRRMATDQLVNLGIHADSIKRHPDCTCCSPKNYLTYRGGDREEVASGVSNILVLTLL